MEGGGGFDGGFNVVVVVEEEDEEEADDDDDDEEDNAKTSEEAMTPNLLSTLSTNCFGRENIQGIAGDDSEFSNMLYVTKVSGGVWGCGLREDCLLIFRDGLLLLY